MAREIISAEKPKYIVMMVGNNDRQSIREKMPVPVRPGAANPTGTRTNPASAPQPAQPVPLAQKAQDTDPEVQPPEQPPANLTPEQSRAASYGPWEFHSEKWEIAYIKRVDATISALKSAGIPVIWVGLPSQRGAKASTDSSYLNEIYRSRADKAGITYVDIWDGFVDEGGRFSPQGPDYEGQIRRLRSGDGVYFTKFGARKLAHYVAREIQRHMINHAVPVALPMPDQGAQSPNAKLGTPIQRPSVGPVVPLTAVNVGSDELLGGRGQGNHPPATETLVSRVLVRGEPILAPNGRADDFSWPRNGVNIDTSPLETLAVTPAPVPVQEKAVAAPRQGAQTASVIPPVQRRSRAGDQLRLPFFFSNLFR
jgi:lysophospholipase L1-like esterase